MKVDNKRRAQISKCTFRNYRYEFFCYGYD